MRARTCGFVYFMSLGAVSCCGELNSASPEMVAGVLSFSGPLQVELGTCIDFSDETP